MTESYPRARSSRPQARVPVRVVNHQAMVNCVTNRNDKWRARQARCSQCRAVRPPAAHGDGSSSNWRLCELQPICRTCAAIVTHRSPGSVAPMADAHSCPTQAQQDPSKPPQARTLLCTTCSKAPEVGTSADGEARPRRGTTAGAAPSEGENLFTALFERRQTKASQHADDSENPFKALLESRKTRARTRTSSANLLGLSERLDRTLDVAKVSETARRNAHHRRQEAVMARSIDGYQATEAEASYHRSQQFTKDDAGENELEPHPRSKVRPRRHTTSTLPRSASTPATAKSQLSSEEKEDEEVQEIAKWSARRRMERALSTPGGALVDLSYLSDFK